MFIKYETGWADLFNVQQNLFLSYVCWLLANRHGVFDDTGSALQVTLQLRPTTSIGNLGELKKRVDYHFRELSPETIRRHIIRRLFSSITDPYSPYPEVQLEGESRKEFFLRKVRSVFRYRIVRRELVLVVADTIRLRKLMRELEEESRKSVGEFLVKTEMSSSAAPSLSLSEGEWAGNYDLLREYVVSNLMPERAKKPKPVERYHEIFDFCMQEVIYNDNKGALVLPKLPSECFSTLKKMFVDRYTGRSLRERPGSARMIAAVEFDDFWCRLSSGLGSGVVYRTFRYGTSFGDLPGKCIGLLRSLKKSGASLEDYCEWYRVWSSENRFIHRCTEDALDPKVLSAFMEAGVEPAWEQETQE